MLGFYLLIAALSFLVLYFAVKKLALNIDENKLLEPIKADIYPKFCDIINDEINDLKENVTSGKLELDDDDEIGEFLEQIEKLGRELNFIRTMNLSKKSDSIWQNDLFNFLKRFDNFTSIYLKGAEILNDERRERLMIAFENLKA